MSGKTFWKAKVSPEGVPITEEEERRRSKAIHVTEVASGKLATSEVIVTLIGLMFLVACGAFGERKDRDLERRQGVGHSRALGKTS